MPISFSASSGAKGSSSGQYRQWYSGRFYRDWSSFFSLFAMTRVVNVKSPSRKGFLLILWSVQVGLLTPSAVGQTKVFVVPPYSPELDT